MGIVNTIPTGTHSEITYYTIVQIKEPYHIKAENVVSRYNNGQGA